MSAAQPEETIRMTESEYLVLEMEREIKHEYRRRVYAMVACAMGFLPQTQLST